MANQTGSDQDGRLEQTAASALCANQAGGWSAKPQITRISNVDEVESVVVPASGGSRVILYGVRRRRIIHGQHRIVRRVYAQSEAIAGIAGNVAQRSDNCLESIPNCNSVRK